MFSIDEFLTSDYRVDYVEEKIGNETFLIRRLDGYERLSYTDIQKSSDRVIYALGHCLLDGKTKKPIGEAYAKMFITRCDALANELTVRIFKLTTDSVKAEEEAWGIAEKNLPETNTSGSIEATAAVTD